ncbi:MAG: MaoC family dehydratase N-terminal domain-containing protein [Betaproteobacteria bacterium]
MNTDGIKGVRGPDYQVPIERGAIRQFARSLYSNHPDWLEDPNPVVPPTFLLSAGYHWGYILERPPAGSALAAIDQSQGVGTDGEHEFRYFGEPPRAGTILTARTQVADHFYKVGRSGGRLEFFVMQTDFHDASGRLAARWRPTSIRTEKVATATPANQQRPAEPAWWRKGETRPQLDAINRASPDDLVVGAGPGSVTLPPLTLTEMIRYQGASGEDSPGHHDALAARAHGYPNCFSVGMQHAGVLATMAAHWLGTHNVRRFSARFLDTVWPGDVLTYQAHIERLVTSDEGPAVELALLCTRTEKPVVKASATFLARP